jgi:hypothetical protein
MEKLRDVPCLLSEEELKEVKLIEKELEKCKKTKTIFYDLYVRYLHLCAKHNGFSNYTEYLSYKNG